MSSRTVSAYSCRAGGDQEASDRSHTRRSPTPALLVPSPHALQPLQSLKTGQQQRGKTPQSKGSSTYPATGGQNGNGTYRSSWVRSSACPYRWKRSAEQRMAGKVCSADVTRLSAQIMRVSDVLCLSAETIHGLVHEWLEAQGLDVRPIERWVHRLLHGMRLRYKKPAKCVKELHSPEQQHANTHRLFIKLCWLVSTHAVGADRVVNIDETSCRLLPVHQIGWGRRGVKQAQLQGNTKEATTFTAWTRGPLDMLVQIAHAGSRPRTAGPPRRRSCSSQPHVTT